MYPLLAKNDKLIPYFWASRHPLLRAHAAPHTPFFASPRVVTCSNKLAVSSTAPPRRGNPTHGCTLAALRPSSGLPRRRRLRRGHRALRAIDTGCAADTLRSHGFMGSLICVSAWAASLERVGKPITWHRHPGPSAPPHVARPTISGATARTKAPPCATRHRSDTYDANIRSHGGRFPVSLWC